MNNPLVSQSRPTFSTYRLMLTARIMSDLEECLRMDLNPEVTRYAFSDIVETEHRERIRQAIKSDVDQKIGFWTARIKESGQFVGWFYLKPFNDQYELEFGYRLKKEFWGCGYARESAEILIDYAFSKLQAYLLCAVTNPGNQRSIALLSRLGFKPDGLVNAYGSAAPIYVLKAPSQVSSGKTGGSPLLV